MENYENLDYVKANRYLVMAMFAAYGFMLADDVLGGNLPGIARQILLVPALLIPLIAMCHTVAWFVCLGHRHEPNMRKARIVLTAIMLIPLGYAIVHVTGQ